MTTFQADDFAAKWTVINQYKDASGAAATVFQEISTGRQYLAIRGTEGIGDINADYILAWGFPSYLNPQFIQLRSVVQNWLDNGTLNSGFTVTGHSLGGYLATALGTWFGSQASHIYTYNAPGVGGPVGTALDAFRAAFDLGDTPLVNGITNIRGTAGIPLISGLGTQLAPPSMVETEFALNPFGNHSIVNLTDSLALYNLYATFDTTLTTSSLNVLTRSASNIDSVEQESTLDALRNLFGQPAVTPTGNREVFWSNLLALQNDPQKKTLHGQLKIEVLAHIDSSSLASRAKEDVGALISLTEFSPIRLIGKDGAAQATLNAHWQNTFGNLYAQWQDDTQLSAEDRVEGKAHFSDEYLADRAAMLSWLMKRNVEDDTGGVMSGPNAFFHDVRTNTDIRLGTVSDANRHQFLFGSDNTDTFLSGR